MDNAIRSGKAQGIGVGPILLIESDFQYSVAISRAFRQLQLLDTLVISVDCENALARLRRGDGARPRLILLDLEMTRMSALSFLRAVKKDDSLRVIPVVALGASNDAEQVSRCYSLGAAGYLVKPAGYAQLLEKLSAFCAYWSLGPLPSMA